MMTHGARCAVHPDVEAVDLCSRCGAYTCPECLDYTEAETLCVTCAQRVGKKAPASAAATTALVLALLSAMGCAPLGPVGAILGHMELARIDRGESLPAGRNLALGAIYVGWIITAIMVLVAGGVALFALVA
ncbi:MAG: DUF4190 domain-containing protein [Sandaracinaceae bacterium]